MLKSLKTLTMMPKFRVIHVVMIRHSDLFGIRCNKNELEKMNITFEIE